MPAISIESFLTLPFQSVQSGAAVVTGSLMTLFWKAAGVFIVVGAIDLFRQLKRHNAQLRMSKQEVKDEHKRPKAIRKSRRGYAASNATARAGK